MSNPDDDRPDADDDATGPDDQPAPRKRLARTIHVHDCANGCGAELHCRNDDCTVQGAWTCPTCEDYIEQQQRAAWALEEERRREKGKA